MKARYIASVLLLLTGNINARGGPQLASSPTPEITISPASADKLPGIDSAVVARFHPTAFILTNESSRAILGLAVQWVYTNQNGEPGLYTHRSDSFSRLNAGVVVPPHGRLLVAPGAFLPERLALRPHTGPSLDALDGRAVPNLASASNIRVQIDCVIFADGEVVGQNQTHYDAQIQGRKIAAEQLAKQVRSAQSRGEDPISMLKQVVETRPSQTDFVAEWTVRLANQLLRAPVFETQLNALENLPAQPKFFRNGGKS